MFGIRTAADMGIPVPHELGLGSYFVLPNGDYHAMPNVGMPVRIYRAPGDPSTLVTPGRTQQTGSPGKLTVPGKAPPIDPTAHILVPGERAPVNPAARIVVPGEVDPASVANFLIDPNGGVFAPQSERDAPGRGSTPPPGTVNQASRVPLTAETDAAPARAAALDPATGRATIRPDGSIIYVPAAGADPIVIQNRHTSDTPLSKRMAQFRTLDDQVRGLIGDRRVGNLPPASERITFLDDARFNFFYAMFGGDYLAAGHTDAFTVSRPNGKAQLIVAREAPHSTTGRPMDLLHELGHYYMHPLFSKMADSFVVEAGDPSLGAPAVNLKEGFAEFLAWKIGNGDSGGTFASHFDALEARYRSGETVEMTYPYATLAAERIFNQLSGDRAYDAIFGGDRTAIRQFREIAETELTGNFVPETARAGDYELAARLTLPFKRPRFTTRAWWAQKRTGLANWTGAKKTQVIDWRNDQKLIWTHRGHQAKAAVGTATWEAPYVIGKGDRGIHTGATAVLGVPALIRTGLLHAKLGYAGKRAEGAFNEFVARFNATALAHNAQAGATPWALINDNPGASAWMQDTVTGAVYLGGLSEALTLRGSHAQSGTFRPYPDWGYPASLRLCALFTLEFQSPFVEESAMAGHGQFQILRQDGGELCPVVRADRSRRAH